MDKDAITTEACPGTDGSLDDACFEEYIESVAQELMLPEDVTRTAVELFRKAKENFRGLWRGDVALACLASAVKTTCLPVSLAQLFKAAGAVGGRIKYVLRPYTSRRAVVTAYRKLTGIYGVKASVCQLTPTIYLERFLKEFEATADERKKAAELNRKILEAKLHVGKNPLSIAAATAYIAFAARVTKRELAKAAGVSEVTIRNNVKRMVAELKIPLSEVFPRL